jgi:hypothetical protein
VRFFLSELRDEHRYPAVVAFADRLVWVG